MSIKGDTLLVNQFNGDNFLKWFSLSDGKVLKSAIKRGDGPDDMLGPLKVNLMSDGRLCIYDRNGFAVYYSDFECTDVKKVQKLPFSTSNIFCINDGKLLASKIPFGVDDEKDKNSRFTIYTDSINRTFSGEYPRIEKFEQNYPVEALAQFHQTRDVCDLPDNRFAVLSSHILSMYGLVNGEYQLLYEKAIAPYDYNYTPSTNNHSTSVELKDGYPKGAMNGLLYRDGYLYVPFRENSEDMSIRCYDLDFNLVKKIGLSKTSVDKL